MDDLYCCYIADDLMPCPTPAAFRIYDPKDPRDETHACAAHAAELTADGEVSEPLEG